MATVRRPPTLLLFALFLVIATGESSAGTYRLEHILTNPVFDGRLWFGASIAAHGGDILVGQPSTSPEPERIFAYLFDGESGALLRSFENPGTRANGFGVGVASIGENILVSASEEQLAAPGSGAAWIFDPETGHVLRQLASPSPADDEYFGSAVAAVAERPVIFAGRFDGKVAAHVFGGFVLQSFVTPEAVGTYAVPSLAASEGRVAIGAHVFGIGTTTGGKVYVFDAATGQLVHSLASPSPSGREGFGWSVAFVGDDILVGAPDPTIFPGPGRAYLFDGTTGALRHVFESPTGDDDDFGWSVGGPSGIAVVGAPRAEDFLGAAYLFDTSTGALLQTLRTPDPAVGRSFGTTVAAIGSKVAVGSPARGGQLETPGTSGAVFVFSRPPPRAIRYCTQNDIQTKRAEKCAKAYAKAVLRCASNGIAPATCDTTKSELVCSQLSTGCRPADEVDEVLDAVYGSVPHSDPCLKELANRATKLVRLRYSRARTGKTGKLAKDSRSCVAKAASKCSSLPVLSSPCADASDPAAAAACVCSVPGCVDLAPDELESRASGGLAALLEHARQLGFTSIDTVRWCAGPAEGQNVVTATILDPQGMPPSNRVRLLYSEKEDFAYLLQFDAGDVPSIFNQAGGLRIDPDGLVESVGADGGPLGGGNGNLLSLASQNPFECAVGFGAFLLCKAQQLRGNAAIVACGGAVASGALCVSTGVGCGVAAVLAPHQIRECAQAFVALQGRVTRPGAQCIPPPGDCTRGPCSQGDRCRLGICWPGAPANAGGPCDIEPVCNGVREIIRDGWCQGTECRPDPRDPEDCGPCGLCSAVAGTNCTPIPDCCGNGVREPSNGETCDDGWVYNGSCNACHSDCTLNTGCGDEKTCLPEVCDGTQLGGKSCEDFQFSGGDLGCSTDCMSFDTARCCANEADLNGGFVGTYTFSGGLTGQVAGTLFHSDNTMSGSVTLTSDYCLRTLTACSTSAQCLEGDTCYHQVLISSVSGNVVCDAITIGNVGGLATFTGTASGSCIDGDWSAPPFGGTWQACR